MYGTCGKLMTSNSVESTRNPTAAAATASATGDRDRVARADRAAGDDDDGQDHHDVGGEADDPDLEHAVEDLGVEHAVRGVLVGPVAAAERHVRPQVRADGVVVGRAVAHRGDAEPVRVELEQDRADRPR